FYAGSAICFFIVDKFIHVGVRRQRHVPSSSCCRQGRRVTAEVCTIRATAAAEVPEFTSVTLRALVVRGRTSDVGYTTDREHTTELVHHRFLHFLLLAVQFHLCDELAVRKYA